MITIEAETEARYWQRRAAEQNDISVRGATPAIQAIHTAIAELYARRAAHEGDGVDRRGTLAY